MVGSFYISSLVIALFIGFVFGQYMSQQGFTSVGEVSNSIVKSFQDKKSNEGNEDSNKSYKLENTNASQRVYDNAQIDKSLF